MKICEASYLHGGQPCVLSAAHDGPHRTDIGAYFNDSQAWLPAVEQSARDKALDLLAGVPDFPGGALAHPTEQSAKPERCNATLKGLYASDVSVTCNQEAAHAGLHCGPLPHGFTSPDCAWSDDQLGATPHVPAEKPTPTDERGKRQGEDPWARAQRAEDERDESLANNIKNLAHFKMMMRERDEAVNACISLRLTLTSTRAEVEQLRAHAVQHQVFVEAAQSEIQRLQAVNDRQASMGPHVEVERLRSIIRELAEADRRKRHIFECEVQK